MPGLGGVSYAAIGFTADTSGFGGLLCLLGRNAMLQSL